MVTVTSISLSLSTSITTKLSPTMLTGGPSSMNVVNSELVTTSGRSFTDVTLMCTNWGTGLKSLVIESLWYDTSLP